MIKEKETANSWLIITDPYDRNRYRKKRVESTFRVHLCPSCNRVYEDTYFNGEGRKTVYHEDFPTYKLKREACSDCEE